VKGSIPPNPSEKAHPSQQRGSAAADGAEERTAAADLTATAKSGFVYLALAYSS
jgi:hypothetical protein